MDVDEAIRSRRTLKAFTDEPVGTRARERAARARRARAQSPRDRAVALLGRRARDAGGAGRGDGRQEAAALAHGDRRRRQARSTTRRRPRRTTPRSRARSRTSCWPRAGAASRASGARPACSRRPVVAKILDVPKKVRLIGVVHLGLPGEPFPPQPERSASDTRTGCRSAAACGSYPDLQPTSKTMPCASGSSLEPLIVAVWRRM